MPRTISQFLLAAFSGATFLLLQGCASGVPFSGIAPAPESRALLYLYRESRITGAAGSNEIYVNGKRTVDLKSGGYLVVTIDPGPIAISHRPTYHVGGILLTAIERASRPEETPKVTFTAQPNRIYYIEGMLAGRLELRDQETALPILRNCVLLSPIDN